MVEHIPLEDVILVRVKVSQPSFRIRFLAVSPEQNPNFLPKQSERGLICAPRPLPLVAGAKTKNFPYLSYFPRRGGWGGPTKNGKEIFGFSSPLPYISYNNLEYNTTEYYYIYI